jgi:hypothetical protein
MYTLEQADAAVGLHNSLDRSDHAASVVVCRNAEGSIVTPFTRLSVP